MVTTKTETTRGHWLEHHEPSSSSVATLTKTETARGPTCTTMAGGDVAARLLQLAINANLVNAHFL